MLGSRQHVVGAAPVDVGRDARTITDVRFEYAYVWLYSTPIAGY
jgi:hypothetical protein